jgi:hypothetical protein
VTGPAPLSRLGAGYARSPRGAPPAPRRARRAFSVTSPRSSRAVSPAPRCSPSSGAPSSASRSHWTTARSSSSRTGSTIYTTEPAETTGVTCTQLLVFDEDDLALRVSSRLPPASAPAPTCDLVEAGMAKMVDVIRAGEVGHRSPEPNSLIPLDPCELVDDCPLVQPEGGGRAAGQGGLRCRHTTEVPDRRLPGRQRRPDRRPAVVGHQLQPGAEQCGVETGHIPFDDASGATGLLEMVLVSADAPPGRGDRMDEACAGVLTIARTLLPRLPSA